MKASPLVHVRPQLSAAIQHVDGVLVSLEAARVIVFLLGNYAKLATACNGCVPDGLVEIQSLLAETSSVSRPRDGERVAVPAVLPWAGEDFVDLEEAVRMLGLKPDSVRNLCRRRVLAAEKRRGRWFIDAAAVAQRVEREGA